MKIQIISRDPEQRATLANPDESLLLSLGVPTETWRADFMGSSPRPSRPVNVNTAAQFAPYYAARRIRAQTLSTLPLIVYRRTTNGGRERAPEHPLYRLLHDMPNRSQTAVEWLEMSSLNMDDYGDAYTFVLMNNAGRVGALQPVHSTRVQIQWDKSTGQRFYVVDGKAIFATEETLHFHNLSADGIRGLSIMQAAKHSIGYGMDLEDYGASFIQNDSSAGGVLIHPQQIGNEGVSGLQDAWEASRTGKNRHRIKVLQEGVKFHPTTISNEDSQFLESRRFSVLDIARFTGVPPHLLYDLERATFSNIEQQSLDFLNNTMGPVARKIEARLNATLFANDPDHYCEFLLDSRLRVDHKTRYDSHAIAINAGFKTPNEVRREENYPALPGGDDLRIPLNMGPADQDADEERSVPCCPHTEPASTEHRTSPPVVETRAVPSSVKLRNSYEDRFRKTADEILAEELPGLRNIVQEYPDPDALRANLERYFSSHQRFVRAKLEPLYREFLGRVSSATAAELDRDTPNLDEFINNVIESATVRWVRSSQNQLTDLEDEAARLQRIDEWTDTRADKFQSNELVQVQNAATRATFVALGVTRLVWRTNGPCPLCRGLEGRTVGVEDSFVKEGENVNGLIAPRALKQPPLHSKCSCFISHE